MYYEIDICCFSAKNAALRIKSKDWLAKNQDNVSEWRNMSVPSVFLINVYTAFDNKIFLSLQITKLIEYLSENCSGVKKLREQSSVQCITSISRESGKHPPWQIHKHISNLLLYLIEIDHTIASYNQRRI